MNENIDLTKILEGCEGIKLWSPLFGEVTLNEIVRDDNDFIISIDTYCGMNSFNPDGTFLSCYPDAECVLFPSKDQRDWSKFEKPSRFPKTYEEARSKFNEDILQCIDEDMRDLFKLIVIRNAWWEADNNWRPDWNDDSIKYSIVGYGDTVKRDASIGCAKVLSFREEDLRDMFLYTHRALIKKCKNYI